MQQLTITQPDDWHVHVRDHLALKRTVADSAKHFGRILCMPNLVPPITQVAEALAYLQRIDSHVPNNATLKPYAALYLTDTTSPVEVATLAASERILAIKYYPAGATTNSHSGVTDITKVYGVLEQMAAHGIPLLLHGEVTHDNVDIFDREKRFLNDVLAPLLQRFPTLPVVLEHITTSDAADFVLAQPDHVAATITPQHLLFNRNHMLVGGIRPHFFCLPILKRSTHQQRLIEVATSGNKKFFLGSDSAPHAQHTKENACGCAGCYTAPIALSLYAEAFEDAGKLSMLEGFASHFGAAFYKLPPNTHTVTLTKQSFEVPATYPYLDNKQLIPLCAGTQLRWTVA